MNRILDFVIVASTDFIEQAGGIEVLVSSPRHQSHWLASHRPDLLLTVRPLQDEGHVVRGGVALEPDPDQVRTVPVVLLNIQIPRPEQDIQSRRHLERDSVKYFYSFGVHLLHSGQGLPRLTLVPLLHVTADNSAFVLLDRPQCGRHHHLHTSTLRPSGGDVGEPLTGVLQVSVSQQNMSLLTDLYFLNTFHQHEDDLRGGTSSLDRAGDESILARHNSTIITHYNL